MKVKKAVSGGGPIELCLHQNCIHLGRGVGSCNPGNNLVLYIVQQLAHLLILLRVLRTPHHTALLTHSRAPSIAGELALRVARPTRTRPCPDNTRRVGGEGVWAKTCAVDYAPVRSDLPAPLRVRRRIEGAQLYHQPHRLNLQPIVLVALRRAPCLKKRTP